MNYPLGTRLMVMLGRRFGIDLNIYARSRLLGGVVVWLDRVSELRRRSG